MPSILLVDWKSIFGVLAALAVILAYVPYLRSIFRRETEPHAYTWLIWAITVATAGAGVWFGGGGFWVTLGFAISTFLVSVVFLLSFKYGTKNVTRGDAIVLVFALLATFVWWGLDNPALAVLMATGIDLLGYIPTYRKSFAEPWSENVQGWIGYAIAPLLSLFALHEYNLMTATYEFAVLAANIGLLVLLLIRQRTVPKPK